MAQYNFIFPLDLVNYTFYMTFNFFQYRVPLAGGQSGAALLNTLGNVRLPMANQMVDHQDIVYSTEELGLVAGAALAKFQQGGGAFNALGAAGEALAQQGLTNLANTIPIGGTAGPVNAFLQSQGRAINPFLTVMFKSPAFKKHAFKWLLSPVNENESRELNAIINAFRYNQLPDQVSGFSGGLLQYPNIVLVTVTQSAPPNLPPDTNNYFSYTFKPAVIESFSVNFSPSGQPSFFGTTGGPTQVEITLSLLEIEYWLQSDYVVGPQNNAFLGSISQILSLVNNSFKPDNTPVINDPGSIPTPTGVAP